MPLTIRKTNLQTGVNWRRRIPHSQIIARATVMLDQYIRPRQLVAMPGTCETFEGALKSGRQALEAKGLGRYEAQGVSARSVILIPGWWRDGERGKRSVISPRRRAWQTHQRDVERNYYRGPYTRR